MKKTCPEDKILNPATNRCVLKTGAIGKAILAADTPKSKACRKDQVLNPKTNRCVKKTSAAQSHPKISDNLGKTKTYNCFRSGLRQVTGTCWFNTIFNSLVLPDATFKMILKQYRSLSSKDILSMNSFTPIPNDSCPLSIKRLYFFKIFQQFLERRKETNNEIILNKKNYPRKMVSVFDIRSTPNWHDVQPGYNPKRAMETVLKILFDKDEYLMIDWADLLSAKQELVIPDTAKIIIIAEKNPRHDYQSIYPQMILKGWRLNSTGIVLRHIENMKAHAITGYVCKRKQYIYNSNHELIYKMDFLNKENVIKFHGGKYNTMSYNYVCLVRQDA